MNERIKELKQQAEAYVDSVDDSLGIEHYRELVDLKFAELIVAECCDIVGDYYGQSKKSGPGYTMICEIKERFGVEE